MEDEVKCPNCGSSNIMIGKLKSPYAMTFIPDVEKGFFKKSSELAAYACQKCGTVFNFKLTNYPDKLTD